MNLDLHRHIANYDERHRFGSAASEEQEEPAVAESDSWPHNGRMTDAKKQEQDDEFPGFTFVSQGSIDEVNKMLDKILSYKPGDFKKLKVGSATLESDEIAPVIQRAQRLIRSLDRSILDDLHSVFIQSLLGEVSEFDKAIKYIEALAENQTADANKEKPRIEHDIKDAYQKLFRVLEQHIAYGVARKLDWSRAKLTIEKEIEIAKSGFVGYVAEQERNINTIVDKAREDADAARVARKQVEDDVVIKTAEAQAKHFDKAADKHKEASDRWLKGVFGTGAALLVWAMIVLFCPDAFIDFDDDPKNAEIIQFVASKTLVFATLTFFAVVCGRNYVSHRHNYVVNQHRANGLKTYRALVEAAGDMPNRNAVLIQAASCIFSPQPSGYGGKESSDLTTARSVVEMFAKPSGGE